MHDPMTVAWEIRLPFLWRERYLRPSILTIWHNDPETDGSDDSCCVRKRLLGKHRGLLQCMGGDESRIPWFLRERAKIPSSPSDAEALLRGALWYVATCTRLDRWSWSHKRVTFRQCEQLACELIHNGVDNVRSSLCLLPGYHTNDRNPDPADVRYPKEASAYWRRELSDGFFVMIAKILSRETARWWQHPRWHFWHWSFQVPLWQRFKRRFIERCSECGKRFKGGSAFTNYHGTRRWCGDCQSKLYAKAVVPPAAVAVAEDPRA